MKVAAVIAEYNPFHNGHLYQLNTLRDEYDIDAIIIVMSGNFTQRGIPSIIDKYTRCQMALECGADLVFELPVFFALGSAEYFAEGAISLLDKLGIVDYLCFGSESGDIKALTEISKTLVSESPTFQAQLKNYLSQGLSFPLARSKALSDSVSKTALSHTNAKTTQEIFKIITADTPNNTLGIEYTKALLKRKSSIRPITIKRLGSGYNDVSFSQQQFASANAIRDFLQHNEHLSSELKTHIPTQVQDMLSDKKNQEFIFADDFSSVTAYKLLTDLYNNQNLNSYYDVSQQLADIFINNSKDFLSFTDFCKQCKSKNITYTRISRCLLHILLDMKQDSIDYLKANDYTSYARLLGFRSSSKNILHLIKEHSSIPMFTKLPTALKNAEPLSKLSIEKDIFASQLYYNIQAQKYHHLPKNEFTQEIRIVKH